jgi:hypothetical protein
LPAAGKKKEGKRREEGGWRMEDGGYKKVLLVRIMENMREDEWERWKERG